MTPTRSQRGALGAHRPLSVSINKLRRHGDVTLRHKDPLCSQIVRGFFWSHSNDPFCLVFGKLDGFRSHSRFADSE